MKSRQFAALPYRMRDDDVEVLFGRSPKGWPIKHVTPQQTAAVEAFEEAGGPGLWRKNT
jgi:hypothetical protein